MDDDDAELAMTVAREYAQFNPPPAWAWLLAALAPVAWLVLA